MMHSKSLVVLAGAALGLSSLAQAQTSDEARAAERELRSDASTRSSFRADAGASAMELGGYTQFQYNLNHRDDVGKNTPGNPDDDDDWTNGFAFANTKITGKGNITEAWSYRWQGRFEPSGGSFLLDDMVGIYTMDNGWTIEFGQQKLPFLDEELRSDTGQQAAERSIVNDAFSARRSQGIWIGYQQEAWRLKAAFSDGTAVNPNHDYDDPTEADWALTGRAEWKWAGEWDRFKDYASFNGSENAGKVGGAIHYQDGGETFNTADMSVLGVTADVAIEGSGWNVAAMGVYARTDPANGDDVADWGAQVQGGFFVSDDWELFLRASALFPDSNDTDPATPGTQDRDDFWAFTGGANYYITPGSHNAKVTLEVIYAPDEQTNSSNGVANVPASPRTGILFDTEGSQWTIRAQLQLVF